MTISPENKAIVDRLFPGYTMAQAWLTWSYKAKVIEALMNAAREEGYEAGLDQAYEDEGPRHAPQPPEPPLDPKTPEGLAAWRKRAGVEPRRRP